MHEMQEYGKGPTDKEAPNDTEWNLPWLEKYRPKSFDQIIGQENVLNIITRFISQKSLPHLLFYGPPGTGKTSTILALARHLYGNTVLAQMVLELNASDQRRVEDVRTQIKTFASSRFIFHPPPGPAGNMASIFKLVILDEADTMEQTAQVALCRIIEDYIAYTRFCIITNHIHRLSPALVSRCTRLRFRPLLPLQIRSMVLQVATKEGISIETEALDYLTRASKGDMRQALALLQECYLGTTSSNRAINSEIVSDYSHTVTPSDISIILEKIRSKTDFSSCVLSIRSIQRERSLDLTDIIAALAGRLQSINVPVPTRVTWLEGLADIEAKLACGGSEEIQAAAVVSVIQKGFMLTNIKAQ